MKYIKIEPLPREVNNTEQVRRCNIKRMHDDVVEEQQELFFQFPASITSPEDDDCDSYLLAVIMDAMSENRDIVVAGMVSRTLLSNLVEFQSAWKKWLPGIYHCINITVDTINEHAQAKSGAICAYSGGVDATFSVWRHSQAQCGYRTQDIKLCCLVHGFDIPLTNEKAFTNASDRARKTLADLDLSLVSMRTNYRKVLKANWEHSCGAALVSALGNLKNIAGTCVIGSSEPYDALVIPWGSSPITDYLLSSGDFNVLHDGASHSRTEKVKEIAHWKIGVENLRVCWAGDLTDYNCGECEKCMRTKMNFLVTGNPIPTCFPGPGTIDGILKVKLTSNLIRGEWQQLYRYAEANNRVDPWMQPLRQLLENKEHPVLNLIFPKGSRRRRLAARLAEKLARR